ncbi:MAG: DHA2 family efflux MFS transporter permease subunit [Hyphomicrobiales bacterium]|nr:DHA2 family efflux MFS transporter permease subunit [Hyphomicrobiales bacterium]
MSQLEASGAVGDERPTAPSADADAGAPAPTAKFAMITPLVVATALFMENLDSTVLSTSLPAIASDLHEDPVALKLALTAYLLSLAIFIPASGWTADRFGARKVFRAAILVFAIGSILCGLSSTLPEFVAARMIQGMGGAMMTPVGRLVLLRSIPRSEIVRALAWLTVPALIGPVIGPPVGGFITTYLHWRWIFWINIPISVLGVSLATMFIPNVREEETPPLDVVGFVLVGVSMASLIFGFSAAGRGVIAGSLDAALIALGFVCLAAYVRHALRAEHPILDLRLLKLPTFRASVGGGFLFRIGIGATPFLLPLMFQMAFGLTPFQSGSLTFVSTLGAMLMKPTAGPILKHLGFRNVLVFNALLSTLFFLANCLFQASTPHIVIICVLLAGGFFRSLEFTAINAVAYAEVPDKLMSHGTSLSAVGQQLSLSVGVTLGAAALEFARSHNGSGSALTTADFTPAFLVVGLVSAASVLFFMRLSPDAGAEISGRRR